MTATDAPRLLVIPPAALALLAEIHGSGGICLSCGRGVKPGQKCKCGARANTAVNPPPGSPPPPGLPCRHCGTISAKLTSHYCPGCYRAKSRLEDYEFAVSSGDLPEVAAERTGVSLRTIYRYQAEWRPQRADGPPR